MNLLADPILSAEPVGAVTLPGLFAASARGEVHGFPRLRAHQRAAWHMFRVQLGALALRAGGLSEPPEDEATWTELLQALAPEHDDDAWRMVVEDRTRPAFLQPPDPGGLRWERVPTPDALDMLITARNHDLKAAVAADAVPEDWVLALVSLQTSEGYGGRGNYGIARMNGGSSSRPFLGFAPSDRTGSPDPSAWWRRDLSVLLRSQITDTVLTRGGPALLWCLPWPEGEQIVVQDMDPWAIEACRRIRLTEAQGRLVAERAGSTAARVEAKSFAGALDDAWAPIRLDGAERKALTLSEGRFDYRRIVGLLLDGDWERPLAARLDGDEASGDMVLIAEALSRGNSKTDGLKSRTVPVPEHVHGFFREAPERISTAAAAQMEEIKAADAALRESVALYAAGGDHEKINAEKKKPYMRRRYYPRAAGPSARLDAVADRLFFPALWDRVAGMETGPEAEDAAVSAFKRRLVNAARSELQAAFAAIPCASALAPRAEARAQARLEGGLRMGRLIEETATHGS